MKKKTVKKQIDSGKQQERKSKKNQTMHNRIHQRGKGKSQESVIVQSNEVLQNTELLQINASQNHTDPTRQKKSIYSVIYIFLGLFVLMTGYFTYFLIFQSNATVNNAYNKRHDILTERVLKGKILASDNGVLAETVINEEGNEIRNYPHGDMFVHVVGKDLRGRTGLEESENISLLTSSLNTIGIMYNDLVGQKSLGDNVVTTLDINLQQIAYDALGDNRGAVVVLEPATGKILAMVSKPSYDPNTIDIQWPELAEDKKEESPFLNRATQGLYPPGSTFKLMTALAYLRENPDYKEYEYDCDGSIKYEGMTIRCYNSKSHGHVDLMRSFAKSCNTSFASIGKGLDVTRFRALCDDFLFNTPLPVAMASNVSRFELQVGSSSVKETMQTAIGQGRTLITPLHNAIIAATVANGGAMMRPYVVDHIENAEGGIIKRYHPQTYATPMTSSEAAYLTGLMNEVVEKGTASDLSDLKVRVAGKTGSADTEGKKAHAWFIGFAPVENPKLAVSVIVENKGTGSEYAVPIAKQIFEAYFNREKK